MIVKRFGMLILRCVATGTTWARRMSGGRLAAICACAAAVGLPSEPVAACRYTVRDVAFVELGDLPYEVFLIADGANPDEVSAIEAIAQRRLINSNVRWEVVTPESSRRDDAAALLERLGNQQTPAAIMQSPDRRGFNIPLTIETDGVPAAFDKALTRVVHSPLRARILDQLPDVHSMVVLVEGSDNLSNQSAKRIAASAIAEIEAGLPFLPKAIENPPQLLTVTREEAQREAVLLWSLGIDVGRKDTTTSTAQVAALFGRGRLLGRVLKGDDVTDRNLIRMLAVAGLDCECGLDRSWMRSPMIPHVWTEQREAVAAKALGFDPGHPLVKVEMSRILSRGPSRPDGNYADSDGIAEIDALLPGLQVIDLDFPDHAEIPTSAAPQLSTEPRRVAQADNPPPRESPAVDSPAKPHNEPSAVGTVALATIAVVLAGLLGGAFILLSARRVGS